jgi:hypothetical protein
VLGGSERRAVDAMSGAQSAMWARMIADAPDRPHLHRLEGVTFRPIFIMGDHRSGTTMLYQWLAATGAFTVVTAYHVIRYDQILSDHLEGRTDAAKRDLATLFDSYGLTSRIIDDVPATPDLPEEYGFVIESRSRPHLSDRTLARFVELCRKLRLVGGDRPVLLKNPWDVRHFVFVKHRFPEARFIFVHREPLAVINSQLRAIRSMLRERNPYLALLAPWYARLFDSPLRLQTARILWDRRTGLGLRLARRHVRRVAEYFLRHVGELPGADVTTLRYEDLLAAPDATMRRLVAFTGATPEAWPAYEDWAAPRPLTLLPEVENRRAAIRRQLDDYYLRAGYGGGGRLPMAG